MLSAETEIELKLKLFYPNWITN